MERGGGALCWEMVCLSDDHDDDDDDDDFAKLEEKYSGQVPNEWQIFILVQEDQQF